jgi:hypothetical protein
MAAGVQRQGWCCPVRVELIRFADDAGGEVSEGWLDLAEDGTVQFHGVEPRRVALISQFVFPIPSLGRLGSIADGEEWLKAFPTHYNGGQMRAARETSIDPSQPQDRTPEPSGSGST